MLFPFDRFSNVNILQSKSFYTLKKLRHPTLRFCKYYSEGNLNYIFRLENTKFLILWRVKSESSLPGHYFLVHRHQFYFCAIIEIISLIELLHFYNLVNISFPILSEGVHLFRVAIVLSLNINFFNSSIID